MDQNQRLGQWLVDQGWIDRRTAELAYRKAQGSDIGAVLVAGGVLSAGQAAVARRAALPSSTPQRVGAYELKRELGRGAMGVVYEVEDSRGQVAAMKISLSTDAGGLARFQREVKVLERLRHPNIIAVRDSGDLDGRPYFVMEFVEGQDLEGMVKDSLRRTGEPPPWRGLGRVLSGAARALEYCHERGVLHRDIKPANILIESATGRAVLNDFGLIRPHDHGGLLASLEGTLTREYDLVGTPAFMAPEQAFPNRGYGSVTQASDAWGFGATLFYALTGEAPFRGSTTLEMLDAIDRTKPRRLRLVAPEVPSWLDELVARCFERDPQARPTLTEIARALERHEEEPAKEAASSVPWFAYLGLPLLAVGLALLVVLGLAREPQLLEVEAATALTNARAVEVTGRTDSPGCQVRIGAILLTTDGEGRFTQSVPLSPGENTIPVSISRPGASDGPLPRELRVVCDVELPTLEVVSVLEAGLVLADPDGRVTVAARDREGAVSVFVDGVEVHEREGQLVKLPRPPASEAPVAMRVEARDAAGNTASLVFDVLPLEGQQARARDARLGAAARVIADERLWVEANAEERGIVAESIAEALGSAFEAPRAEVTRLGRASCWKLTVRHRASGIEMAVIPGGTLRAWQHYPANYLAQDILKLDEDARGACYLGFIDYLSDVELQRHGATALLSTRQMWVQQASAQTLLFLGALKLLAAQDAARTTPNLEARLPFWPYLMATTELSRGQWAKLVGLPRPPEPDLPQTDLSYTELRRGLKGIAGGLRVPIRWEWERAVEAIVNKDFFWGSDPAAGERYAWTLESGGGLRPVTAHRDEESLLGLSDLHGNAWELVCYTTDQFGNGAPNPQLVGGGVGVPALLGKVGPAKSITVNDKRPDWGVRLVAPIPGLTQPSWVPK